MFDFIRKIILGITGVLIGLFGAVFLLVALIIELISMRFNFYVNDDYYLIPNSFK